MRWRPELQATKAIRRAKKYVGRIIVAPSLLRSTSANDVSNSKGPGSASWFRLVALGDGQAQPFLAS
jgi:hypothetical protein